MLRCFHAVDHVFDGNPYSLWSTDIIHWEAHSFSSEKGAALKHGGTACVLFTAFLPRRYTLFRQTTLLKCEVNESCAG